MIWEHFRAVVWLRWRLFRNRLSRSGTANTVITAIALVLGGVLSVAMFFVALFVGMSLLPRASADHVLYLWNIVVAAFLFFWFTGLMTELQRSEVLAIEKLLHFPTTLAGTFLVNYLSSFVSLTLVLFLPSMIGLCLASIVALGPSMFVLLPLLAAFVFAVTAVTYQFRGWLATLMVNKRKRRTILACLTAGFILLVQIPNLINMSFVGSRRDDRRSERDEIAEQVEQLSRSLEQGEIDREQFSDEVERLEAERIDRRAAREEAIFAQVTRWVVIADRVLPPGWFPLGARAAAQHRLWPGLLGASGLFLIGGVSLRRSYRATLRFYRGEVRTAPLPKPEHSVATRRPAGNLLERNLPWLPEQAAATALATFRSLLRAPEVKMMLLTPFIMALIFGSSLVTGDPSRVPAAARPLVALGTVAMTSLFLAQLIMNQFGFDREGFRTYVLSPAPRRDILLGKNVALAPFSLVSGVILVTAVQILLPLSFTHFAAALVQLLTGYLLTCVVANQTSILLPGAVRSGSMRTSQTTAWRSLQMFLAMLVMLAASSLIFVPLVFEVLVEYAGWGYGLPLFLILSVTELAAVAAFYRLMLKRQGELLQHHEQKILTAVAAKND